VRLRLELFEVAANRDRLGDMRAVVSSSTGIPPIGLIFRNSGLRLSASREIDLLEGNVVDAFFREKTRTRRGFGAPVKS